MLEFNAATRSLRAARVTTLYMFQYRRSAMTLRIPCKIMAVNEVMFCSRIMFLHRHHCSAAVTDAGRGGDTRTYTQTVSCEHHTWAQGRGIADRARTVQIDSWFSLAAPVPSWRIGTALFAWGYSTSEQKSPGSHGCCCCCCCCKYLRPKFACCGVTRVFVCGARKTTAGFCPAL